MLSFFGSFPGYEQLNYTQRFRLIRQAGFDGVLLGWIEQYERPDYRDQPELARREGLLAENVHVDFFNASHIWEDTPEGQAVFEYYLKCADDCAASEIPAMVLHASYGMEQAPASELGLERFKHIADRAERRGVNVAVENMCTAEGIAKASCVLEHIDSPRLGFCFDSGHYNARRVPEMDMLARFGHRLMALHLHDNDGTDDQHLLPFDGTTDWPAQMRSIAATGFRGATALEVFYRGDEAMPPEEFLARAYERAVRLEALRNL